MNNFFRVLAVFSVAAASLFAQADRGSVVGTITDASGAVVTNIALTLRNDATNLTYNATTGENGTYSILNLPIGTYTAYRGGQGLSAAGSERDQGPS